MATTPAPSLDMQLVTRAYTDRIASDARDALSQIKPLAQQVTAAITSTDTSTAQCITSGSATKDALGKAIAGVIDSRNYLTLPGLDQATAGNIGASDSATRKALSTLISQTTPATSGGTSTSSGGPRFFVEDYRRSAMSDDQVVRAAIQAAAKASATFEHPIVEFAARSYDVTHGVFSDIGVVVQAGMTFVGQGYTTLRLMTGGQTDRWFYDNGSSAGSQGNDAKDNRRLAFAKWEGFNFTTDDPTRAGGNGFRFTGIGLAFEQNYTFDHCRFGQLNTVFATAGTLNTDSIRLYACYGYDLNTVMLLSNNQSVELEWHGTTFELIRKDALVVGSGGGGDVKILGGSWVMEKVSGDSGTYAFLSVAATDSTAWGNGSFVFTGIKPELRDADTMLARLPGPAGAVYAHFIDCNLHTANATEHDMVLMGANRRVTFTNCQLPEGGRYVFDVGYEVQSLPAPRLSFQDCETPEDLPAKIRWKNARFGVAMGRGNRAINPQSAFTTGMVNDFDLNVLSGGLRGVTVEKKILPLFPAGMYAWPCADTNAKAEWNVVLPPGALLTRIVLNRPALSGSSSTAYQLAVTNGDKSTTYASTSSSGTYGAAVALDQQVSVQITTDPTDTKGRTVKLYAPKPGDTSPAAFGVGVAFVEYI